METSRFPNKLRTYRRCIGFSRKKMARMLGLADTSMLSRWERGIAMPGAMQVFRLARIYRTQPHDLYDKLWQQLEQEVGLLAQDEEPFISNQSSLCKT